MSKFIYTTKYKTVFDLGYLLLPLLAFCVFLIVLKVFVTTNSINSSSIRFLLNWIKSDDHYNSIFGACGFVTAVVVLGSALNYRVALIQDKIEAQRLYWSKKKIPLNECTGFSIEDVFKKGTFRYEKGLSGSGKDLPEVFLIITLHLKNQGKITLPEFQVQLFDDNRLFEVESFFKEILPEISRKIEFLEKKGK